MATMEWIQSAAQYVIDNTRHVIETFGPRDPGSDGERQAQEHVLQEIKEYADETHLESFQLAPKAFMGFMPVTGSLLIISMLLFAFFPLLAFIAAALGASVAVSEFLLYRQVLDPFFPKRTSHNVYAIRRASGEAKRRIIVSGHIDAAYEMRYNLMGRWVLLIVSAWAIGGVLYLVVLNLTNVVLGATMELHIPQLWHTLEWLQLAFLPSSILALFYTRFSVVAPGANDNLTGVFTATALLKHLHESGIRFDNTEVWCLSAGSEEGGLRGAKAFVKKHADELTALPTAVIVLDTFRDTEHLVVMNRDMNGLVRHDEKLCALLQRAGAVHGIHLKYSTIYAGSSDATAFTQAGIPSAALVGMDPAPPRYYHTRLDHWNIMNAECIERALIVTWEAVQRYAENGL
ncbi:MAG TPA: M20/M25/M40 family metallo-hydrolase [Candidatus Hydrogenedentes bacterium]|nr:M20/M25/M40 family metallo-hydrolase [Candidatus Hydrogenedentota bacterium]